MTRAALMIVCLLLSVGRAEAAAGWRQSPSLRAEVARASAQGKQIVVKVSTAWCSACRELDQVLARPNVKRALAGYVRLAYDAEVGEGEDVAKRYNAVTFPTLLVLGGDGLEIDRVSGSMKPPELLRRLAAIKAGSGTVKRLEARLARRPDDLALRLRVGRAWAFKGRRVEAEKQLKRIVAADSKNEQGLAARALLVQGKYLLLRSLKRYKAAARVLGGLRKRFPRAPEAEQAVYPLARALHYGGKSRDALTLISLSVFKPRKKPLEMIRRRSLVGWFCWYHKVYPQAGYKEARVAVEQTGVKLDPKEKASFVSVAGLLATRLGRLDEARNYLQLAVKLDPANAWYRRNLNALKPGPKGP
jgi:tetratricopeptide (TPR) repeat protein